MVAPSHLTLIVDTNLFLECRSLEEIPWDDLNVAQIDLIISRPVLKELDEHKKNRAGRTFKKALEAGKRLRKMVTGGTGQETIRGEGPLVTLSIMQASRIKPDLAQELDPNFPDDAILLRLLEYQSSYPDSDVRLLTHDTGPMATAKGLDIPFIAIPAEWLLKDQDDPVSRENRKLASENERLRKQEPNPEIRALDGCGEPIARIEAKRDRYDELSYQDIERLISELRSTVPIANDFGSPQTVPQPDTRRAESIRGVTVNEFRPASEKEIEQYRNEQYPAWLDKCREYLEKLHTRLYWHAERPTVNFELANRGTRPAINCLVSISARGDLQILPPQNEEADENEYIRPVRRIGLPKPPNAPMGKWVSSQSRAFESMLGAPDRRFVGAENLLRPLTDRQFVRDSDKFYWKDRKPYHPEDIVQFECQTWRHNVELEYFPFEIFVSGDAEVVSGAIQCEVHAENLSTPISLTLPVRISSTECATIEKARELIAELAPQTPA